MAKKIITTGKIYIDSSLLKTSKPTSVKDTRGLERAYYELDLTNANASGGGDSIYTANGTTTDEERILNTPNGLLEMFIGTKSGLFEIPTDSFILKTKDAVASEIPGLNPSFHYGVLDAEGEVSAFGYLGDFDFQNGTLTGFMHIDGKPQIAHSLVSGDTSVQGNLLFENNRLQIRFSASDDVTGATGASSMYFGGHSRPQYTFLHSFSSIDHSTPGTEMIYEASVQHDEATNNILFNAIYSRPSVDTDYLVTFGTSSVGTFIGMESEVNDGTISIGQYNSSSGSGAVISCDSTDVTLTGSSITVKLNNIGLNYDADYSGFYTDRSVPDVAWVNGYTGEIRRAVLEIGDWDMDANQTTTVAHGLTLSKIRNVEGVIRNDADDTYYSSGYIGAAGNVQWTTTTIDATNITLTRRPSGDFDNTGFDSTSFNRGWLIVDYVD